MLRKMSERLKRLRRRKKKAEIPEDPVELFTKNKGERYSIA